MSLRRAPSTPARTALAAAAVAILAVGFAGWRPASNTWPALAVLLALVLDAASRRIAAAVAHRRGVPVALRGLPSPALALGRAHGLGGLSLGLTLAVWPAGFPVLASAFAGLVAMGAFARLALARAVARPLEDTSEEP